MATPVIMPKQGQSVESCVITSWFKKKGEKVKTGEILCSYETDKASFDLESPADGLLLDVFFSDGDEVPVLTNIAVIGSEGEKTESFRPGIQKTRNTESDEINAVTKTDTLSVNGTTPAVITEPEGRIKISPKAKKMAQRAGINFSGIKGTGPNGRIIARDIENAWKSSETAAARFVQDVSAPVTGTESTDKPVTNIRRIIAAAMHASLQNSAQLTHHMSADVRRLLEARKKFKEAANAGKAEADITINDMICFCVIKALMKFPELNSHFLGETIRTFNRVNLGLAVDTPRGLMVPAIPDASGMNLITLSNNLRSAAEACRRGNINPELLKSTAASFTVTNLGAYGVEMFTPVLNLPQVGILGVCTITHRPADLGNGIMGFIPVIGLSLTYDHRAVDGGPATLFLKEVKEQIENIDIALI